MEQMLSDLKARFASADSWRRLEALVKETEETLLAEHYQWYYEARQIAVH
jgi:hypothetical protein